MYASIDLLLDKLDRQVRRHKDRITDHPHIKHNSVDIGGDY